MIEVMEIKILPTRVRVGIARLKYHELEILAEIVVYEDKHLWVRMPEKWVTRSKKVPFCWWGDKAVSDRYQQDMVKQLKEKHGLDLAKAIELKKSAMKPKKPLTPVKTKLTVGQKSPKK